MPEILIISGKGGTGKTSLTAAFAHLAENPIVCDLDVDAPDLHLLLHPKKKVIDDFYAGYEASILSDLCSQCDICRQMCLFKAIKHELTVPIVDPLKCEGCKVCVAFCPENAIEFTPKHCGTWYQSETRFGSMVHAQLFPGEDNSGRLVALLRQKAKEIAMIQGRSLILADGPPGIGCPVISAISGVTLAVIVIEPTPSGYHDLNRIVSLCEHFKTPTAVIINKVDLNADIARKIEIYCNMRQYHIVAKLPNEPQFVHAMVEGKTITEYLDGPIVGQIKHAWRDIVALSEVHLEASKI